MTAKDAHTRFHEEWLGLAQPIEGLVFSVPVLADAQIAPAVGAELSSRFARQLAADAPVIADLRRFFTEFLGYSTPGMLVDAEQLPAALHFYAEEGRQDLRPTFALARGPFAATDDPFAAFEPPATVAPAAAPAPTAAPTETAATPARPGPAGNDVIASPWVALVWELPPGLSLDKPEDQTGAWRYPPTAKFERLLRHSGVPVGLLANGRELRLVYAPPTESTSHLTFRVADLAEPAGRPILAAAELLLAAKRTYEAGEAYTLEGLLRESRRRQADVTKELAAQVFEAVELLLEGFESAALRSREAEWLRAALDAPDDHLYQGVLSVILRLVFLLYAEDQGLMPVGHPTYARHMSVQGLYDELVEDAGMHPESMHHRFGAYGRLLSLFRAVFFGVAHGDLQLPPRRGRLFDPSSYPFLEGGLPGSTAPVTSPEARAELAVPAVDDGTVHALLDRLVLFEGQRLSYRALDVEQIGSVYESLMGYHVLCVGSPAVRVGKHRVWLETAPLRDQKGAERKKWLKEACGLSSAQQDSVEAALSAHADDDALAQALSSSKKGSAKARDRVAAGRLVLQPGEERRRSGSHYTPRSLTERIVRRTLEPILACLGPAPTQEQLLSLKICDPAMGSGAFLVETCRHLADQLVAAWARAGTLAAEIEVHGDAHLHARRLVAQRCLYGVDKNDAAVELAKLSLWLVTLGRELPFTFVDHALRHGDSLVGLDLEQVSSFDWRRSAQVPLFAEVLKDCLEQALAHRREIHQLASLEDAVSQQEKRRLLDHADHATERIRLVADACVGAFFAESKDKAREAERGRRMGLVERWLGGEEALGPQVQGLAEELRRQHAPFHWWLEFPEVFYEERPDPLDGGKVNGAAYMEAFVGNPPFMGKNNVIDVGGPGYLDWLKTIHAGAHGNADLSAHFFRRADTLLGAHGTLGLIATNTIAQGDTRATGLQYLVGTRGHRIYDAVRSMPWPGEGAAVTVSIVHLAHGTPAARELRPMIHDPDPDDETKLLTREAEAINSRLRPKPERADPVALSSNAELSFQGSIVLGQGFVLTPAERDALIAKDARNGERIFPYLGGEEVNTNPDQGFDRYVISFGTIALEEAERWPDLLAIVREKVKPERDKNNREVRKKYWWRFGETTPALYAAMAKLDRVLVSARVTKHLCFSFQPTDRVLNEKLVVHPVAHFTPFAILQSRVYTPWAWLLSSTMKSDLNYAPSDCFEPFPFPEPDPRAAIPELEAIGERLYTARASYMRETSQGLTKTYNALKDPARADPALLALRQLHLELDQAVLAAYGWSDLRVPPYVAPGDPAQARELEAFEEEVIDRLFALNEQRAREEARLGAGKHKGTKGKAKPRDDKAQLGLGGVK